jgi:hypothetical protein
MYIWRIPIFVAIALAISILILSLCAVLFHIRSRVRTPIARGICLAGVLVALLTCPILFVIATEPFVAAWRERGRYIDQGFALGWYSALLVVFVLAGSRFLFPRRPNAFRWRAGFAALVIGFIVLNVANWCSPGWCGRFGFPFSYSWWGDVILEINGQNLSAGTSVKAFVANVCVLLVAIAALAVSYRLSKENLPPRVVDCDPESGEDRVAE